MNQTCTFDDFCRDHYGDAVRYADIAVASFVKANGKLDRRMDVEKVKSLAVFSALENAFKTYDPTRNTKLSTYLSLLVSHDIQSELGKEWTEVKKFAALERKRKKRQTAEEKAEEEAERKRNPESQVGHIMPGVKSSGDDMSLFEPAEMMDIYGSSKGKEKLTRDMMRKFQQLTPMDQLVLRYWMNEERDDRAYEMDGLKPQRTYVQRILDELGLDESSVNAITIRCFKAKQKLAGLMKGTNTDYNDIYIPGSSSWEKDIASPGAAVKIYSDSEYEKIGNSFYRKVFE